MNEIADESTFASHTVTQAAADSLIQGALRSATDLKAQVVIAVVDSSGHLKTFTRMDEAMFMTIDIAIDKAWTSAAFGMATHTWGQVLKQFEGLSQYAHRPRLVAVGGGYPLLKDGKVVGGIGVSGGRHLQDRQIAEAAIHSVGFELSGDMALAQNSGSEDESKLA